MVTGGRQNSDVDWDAFDANKYLHHNYQTLRGDDRRFIEATRDHFAASPVPSPAAGIDLGAGANLYPAFTMLPFVERLTLLDYSYSNIEWLRAQVRGYDPGWDPFWDVLRPSTAYAEVADPREKLNRVASVVQASLFTFVPVERYDIGTMFFVAESISTSRSEFEVALARFLAVLKPGAPFATAFMENSAGYQVGAEPFPATRVSKADVDRLLSPAVEGLSVHHEPAVGAEGALRLGYDGMILAVGRKKV
jgi:hypothetical protein